MTAVKPHQHGTQTGYQYGCRCNRCREAQRLYMADLRARHAERAAVNPRGRKFTTNAAGQFQRPTLLQPRPDWFDHAECKGMTEVMFPTHPDPGPGREPDYGPAMQACERCPVIDDCWSWVVDNIPSHEIRQSGGVWAGRTPREAERQLRTIRRRTA